MKCVIERSRLSGEICCPASKSYTHRAIFLASLADGPSTIANVLASADTDATVAACRSLGAEIEQDGDALRVTPRGLRPADIDAANSGTTIRIASAVSALAEGTSTLTGDESLRRRPMQPLLDALGTMGARCSSREGRPPVTVTGRIAGGHIDIPGNISSQFISALMISAPMTRSGVTISIQGDLVSKPYLEATISAMRRFGVVVHTVIPFRRYAVAPQAYRPASFTVPSDSSSLALLLAAAVLAGEKMKIRVAFGDLPQGDESFIDILEVLGIRVDVGEDVISVDAPGVLAGGRFDLGNTPDLLPPLAILSARCSAPLEIVNVGHARFKETDRIAVLASQLAKAGIGAVQGQDSLTLTPGALGGAHLDPHSDHRLFMAFCILAMAIGDCTVEDPESVRISYPSFIEDVRGLGAKLSLT